MANFLIRRGTRGNPPELPQKAPEAKKQKNEKNMFVSLFSGPRGGCHNSPPGPSEPPRGFRVAPSFNDEVAKSAMGPNEPARAPPRAGPTWAKAGPVKPRFKKKLTNQ